MSSAGVSRVVVLVLLAAAVVSAAKFPRISGVDRIKHKVKIPQSVYIDNAKFKQRVRVINGDQVDDINETPYAVFIIAKSKTTGQNFFTCTAALVANDLVYTAAHCVDDDQFTYSVCGGVKNVKDLAPGTGGCSQVIELEIPSQYDLYYEGYDIAVLLLKSDITTVGAVPAAVGTKRRYFKPYPQKHRQGYVVGFGKFGSGSRDWDGQLRQTDVKIYSEYFSGYTQFPQEFFLAADGNHDGSKGGACSGDSGGPLVTVKWSKYKKASTHIVQGVMSFVFVDAKGNCDPTLPSMVSRFGQKNHKKILKEFTKRLGRDKEVKGL